MKLIKKLPKQISLILATLILFASCSKYELDKKEQLNIEQLIGLHEGIKENFNQAEINSKTTVQNIENLKIHLKSDLEIVNQIGLDNYLKNQGFSYNLNDALLKMYISNNNQNSYEILIQNRLISSHKDAALVFYAYEYTQLIKKYQHEKSSLFTNDSINKISLDCTLAIIGFIVAVYALVTLEVATAGLATALVIIGYIAASTALVRACNSKT